LAIGCRAGRPLLRRVRINDPDFRQRLHHSAYATLGEFIAWIIGWDLVLEYLFGASTVAVGWSGYVVSFLKDFNINIPAVFSQAPLSYSVTGGWHATGAILNCPAIFIVGLMTTLLVIGIRESTRVNNVIVIIKLIVIVLFVGVGVFFIKLANWSPFLPDNTGQFGHSAGAVLCAAQA